MALGARIGQVKLLVLRQGARIALPGIILGLAAGAALARFVEVLLFGVNAFDPAVYSAVAATTALTVLAASGIPAQRTARVDPARTLRGE
jgi:ABC-type antimicrobial peptide transport system permease subunit